MNWISHIESKPSRVNSSFLSLELNGSIRPFCQGEPWSQNHGRKTMVAIFGPDVLSFEPATQCVGYELWSDIHAQKTWCGALFAYLIKDSDRFSAVIRRAALLANASRVNSSVTFRILTSRPSAISSNR